MIARWWQRAACVALVVVGGAAPLSAQTGGARTWEQIQASFDTHKGEFDYLLGDWAFTAVSQEYGEFRGYWSAVRLDEGQILDPQGRRRDTHRADVRRRGREPIDLAHSVLRHPGRPVLLGG